MITKPNFVLIGASKCATSSICSLLGSHPDVFMTQPKEPHFFSREEVYERGFEWYQSLFETVNNEKMIGEGSNTYTMKEVYPLAFSRLTSYVSDLKFIYCVRDPIPRIESYWKQSRTHGGEEVHYDFNTAVRVNRHKLVDSANYWQQINVYRNTYPDDKIHIIFFEDFKSNPDAVMRRCFEFLDVDPAAYQSPDNKHLAQTTGKLAPRKNFSRLRSNPAYKSVIKFIPTNLLQPIKTKVFFSPIQAQLMWEKDNRNWVADILEDDTHKFLEFYGKPRNFWNLRG